MKKSHHIDHWRHHLVSMERLRKPGIEDTHVEATIAAVKGHIERLEKEVELEAFASRVMLESV